MRKVVLLKQAARPKNDNYHVPPHGGRPPSDEAVRAATQRYIQQEKEGKLANLPSTDITRR